MKKNLLRISLALGAMSLLMQQGHAQEIPDALNPAFQKMTIAERTRAKKEFAAENPLLFKQKALVPRHFDFPNASMRITGLTGITKSPTPLFVNSRTVIWGNLAFRDGWSDYDHGTYGYYSFTPTSPLSLSSLYETPAASVAQNGVQYKNGHIYGLDFNSDNAYLGYYLEYLYDTDTKTGKTTRQSLSADTQRNLVATETAQADDGTVYGEFLNSSGTAYEWGTVDYSTLTRTTIGPATHTFVAIGITKAGQLYGIADDGNLYKIDKTNGTETLVGATGLTIATSEGQHYGQTGEINQHDDTFYWFAIDATGKAGLYEVNLGTGAATKISDSDGQLYGMIIPAPEAEDGAPAKASGLTLSFEGTSLSGTATFTAPDKTFADAALTGNLTYSIKANGNVVATGTTTPGASVTANITVPASGSYDFEVTTSNSIGESPKLKATKWVGFDIPSPVSGFTLSRNGQNVTVSWKAPVTGVHGGAIGSLAYDVYRIVNNDTTKVASDLKDTTFTDNIGNSTISYYTYAVKAKSEGLESALAASDGIVAGNAIEPTWTEEFNTENDFKLFTVIDANKDGRTWNYPVYLGGGEVVSNYNYSNGNDDWLFTPPIHLTPGRLYNITFKAKNASQGAEYMNSLEVKWGNDTTAAAMTNTLLATTKPSNAYTVYTYEIKPTAEGNYYIGFHDNTEEAGMYQLELDSIVVERGPIGSSPEAVEGLTVTPAARGKLAATLNFTIASKTIDGDNLSRVDSVQIMRDGVVIATLKDGYSAGSSQSYTDNAVPTNGVHRYDVIPYLAEEAGRKATASAFIGQGIPKNPSNVTFVDNESNILTLWDSFSDKGVNGGYVDPSNVSVSFFKLVEGWQGYSIGDSIYTSEPGATRTELPQNPEETTASDGKTQTLYQLAARANAEAGTSSYVMTRALVIGPSINLPFKESLAGGKSENGFAWMEGNSQWSGNSTAASWRIYNESSVDADGGCLLWSAYTQGTSWRKTDYTITAGDETSINTPKVALKGSTNPKLYFSLYATADDPAELKVLVQTPDGVDHEAKTLDLSKTTKAGWTTQNVDLTPYASQRYVIIKFKGIADGAETYIGIDNINIFDQLEYNLAATGISAPASVNAGSNGNVDVYVENFGAHPAKDYSVVLYADNKAVDTVSVAKDLDILAFDTVTLKLPVAINKSGEINVKAEIVYDKDLDLSNNSTESKTVRVISSEYNKVNDLKATANGSNVSLNWSKPEKPAPVQVTEDFESYGAFDTNIGSWTTIDADKGIAGDFVEGLKYPGLGTAFAFEVFNPKSINALETYPGLAAHGGEQYLGAPDAVGADGIVCDANNWIISPELSGKKQTVTFYASNAALTYYGSPLPFPERIEVLYSTQSSDTATFTKVLADTIQGENVLTSGANWTKVTFDLPEGAKYFAIHHISRAGDNLLFGIDDISFEKLVPGTNDSIVGYNVYRDGELIGTVNGNTVIFNDEDAGNGSHVYNVTVDYQDKNGGRHESGFSNDATVTVVDGISSIVADENGKFDVYTIDGKSVILGAKSLIGLQRGLYIINGRKYVIK